MFTIETASPGSAAADSIVRAYLLDVASRWHGRPATPEDVDQALSDEPYGDLRDDTGAFLVAVKDEKAVACAGVRFIDGAAELTKVFTLPGHRERGAGSQLIKAA